MKPSKPHFSGFLPACFSLHQGLGMVSRLACTTALLGCVVACRPSTRPASTTSATGQASPTSMNGLYVDRATPISGAAWPTYTLVSDIGKVRQIEYAANPKLYKIALVMYMSLRTIHPNFDADGAIIENIDGDAPTFNSQLSPEANIRNYMDLSAKMASGDWRMSAPERLVLQDAGALANGIENGTEDGAVLARFVAAAGDPDMPLNPNRLADDAKAMAVIRIKAPGRPPIDFQTKDGTKGHVEYLKNPKLYCAISRFFKVQSEIGESWDITTAQTVLHTYSHADMNSWEYPYTELPKFISMESRMEYGGQPEAQRKLAELSIYIEGLSYQGRLYDGD